MKRILLVDNDAEVLEATCAALEAEGYEVLVARDGNQALALAEQGRPDLMVLELAIPHRSGFAVLERLQPLQKMSVIITTTFEASRFRLHAAELGVSNYIRKPYLVSDLITILADCPNAVA